MKWILVAALAISGSCYADDKIAQEMVTSFEGRVTQDLHPVEREYLVTGWGQHKELVIRSLRDGNENTRRICAQVVEASGDTSLERELIAAYTLEQDEKVKQAVIYALSSCKLSDRVLSFAFEEFQRVTLDGFKVAWCIALIKNKHPDAKLSWDYLLNGLEPFDDVNKSEIQRRAYSYRVRDTCIGLSRLGIEAERALPRLELLVTSNQFGVVTRYEVKDIINLIKHEQSKSSGTTKEEVDSKIER